MAKEKDNLPSKAADNRSLQKNNKKLWMRIAVLVMAALILLAFIALPLFT
ncbi:MAG: hypothetical protein NC093_05065 [Alistipes sp.]|nr:hypothetical protein [Alistipes sp.]